MNDLIRQEALRYNSSNLLTASISSFLVSSMHIISSTSSNADSIQSSNHSNLQIGIIIGIVVGVTAFLVILGIRIVYHLFIVRDKDTLRKNMMASKNSYDYEDNFSLSYKSMSFDIDKPATKNIHNQEEEEEEFVKLHIGKPLETDLFNVQMNASMDLDVSSRPQSPKLFSVLSNVSSFYSVDHHQHTNVINFEDIDTIIDPNNSNENSNIDD